MSKIYLDTAATSKVSPWVLRGFQDIVKGSCGNMRGYNANQGRYKMIEESREAANALFHNSSVDNIFFGFGSTQIFNMIKQIVEADVRKTDNLTHVAFDGTCNFRNDRKLCVYTNYNNIGGKPEPIKFNPKDDDFLVLDATQEIYHHKIDATNWDLIVCSAHKLHGLGGVGFAYISPRLLKYCLENIENYSGGSFREDDKTARRLEIGTLNWDAIIANKIAFEELSNWHQVDYYLCQQTKELADCVDRVLNVNMPCGTRKRAITLSRHNIVAICGMNSTYRERVVKVLEKHFEFRVGKMCNVHLRYVNVDIIRLSLDYQTATDANDMNKIKSIFENEIKTELMEIDSENN